MRERNLVDNIAAFFQLSPMLRQKLGLAEEVEACINYLGEAYMRAVVKDFGLGEDAMAMVRKDFEPHLYNWIARTLLSNGMVVCDMRINPPSHRDQGRLVMRLYYTLSKLPDERQPYYFEFENVDLTTSQGRFHM